jgi:2-keto-4-pentenoate hydratase/2-oxohepta-3-ene-1,7-dioic acid hydratase in catechol pathway
MKLCRFQPLEFTWKDIGHVAREERPEPRAGVIENGTVFEISGELWGSRERTSRHWPLDEVKLLPPAVPTKIVCVGRNYFDHAKELGNEVPKEPLIFLKPPSAVIAPDEPILLPRISERVDFEGELGVIIGRRCFHLGQNDDAQPFIAGYTCVNDVTARDLQKRDGQWSRAKGFDTFCPFGPLLETEPPPPDTAIETFVNGVRKQSGRLAEMIFPVDVIIRWITQAMTLEPGDLIATGTPAGVGPLAAGDVVEVSIGGIGTLSNPVRGFED